MLRFLFLHRQQEIQALTILQIKESPHSRNSRNHCLQITALHFQPRAAYTYFCNFRSPLGARSLDAPLRSAHVMRWRQRIVSDPMSGTSSIHSPHSSSHSLLRRSFTPGLKPPFSTNPSHRSLPSLLQY